MIVAALIGFLLGCCLSWLVWCAVLNRTLVGIVEAFEDKRRG